MKRIKLFSAVALAGLWAFAGQVAADRVIFTSGLEQQGIVIEDPTNPDRIILENHTGRKTVRRSLIREIIKEEPYRGHLAIARGFVDMKNDEMAITHFLKAAELGAPETVTQQGIAAANQRIADKQEQDRQKALDSIDSMLAQAKRLTDEKQFDAAEALYNRMERMELTPAQGQVREDRLKTFYYEWGKNRLDHVDAVNAAIYLEKAVELDGSNGDAKRLLIESWEREKINLEGVAEYYVAQARETPHDYDIQAKAGNALFEMGDFQEALRHYLYVFDTGRSDLLGTRSRTQRAFQRLHEDAADEGNFEMALIVYQQFLERFPEADPMPALTYEYAVKRSNILAETFPTTDTTQFDSPEAMEEINSAIMKERLNQLAELAFWLRGKGLRDLAQKELAYVLEIDPQNQLAQQGQQLFARETLEMALASFNNRDYIESIQLAQDTIRKYSNQGLVVEQASDLVRRARNELDRELAANRERGKDLVLQGDEDVSRAEYSIQALRSALTRSDVGSFNDYHDASMYLERAIERYQLALSIDPTLASTMSVTQKITDAQRRMQSLRTNRRPARLRAIPQSSSRQREMQQQYLRQLLMQRTPTPVQGTTGN